MNKLIITPKDAEKLFNGIVEPEKPNKKLQDAAKKYKK